MFAGKLERDWRGKIECGQAPNEQWIVFVGGLPQNSMQLLNKTVARSFHVSGT
jgi:hypothetical protein